jgi:GNAT superfamily N-acetyltransferase
MWREEAVTVVGYSPAYRAFFESLNREWLERWFTVEPKDEWYFCDPVGTIIEPGGAIFFALEGGTPVGTAAALRHDSHTFELGKMAVTPRCQGRGYGRALAEAVIRHAAEAGATRVIVLSDSKLTDALRLYERLGFRHAPPPGDTGYARGDVYMLLELPAR